MRVIARDRSEQNQAMLDPWSIVHFGVGIAAGLVDLPLRAVLPLAIIYEIVEQELESRDVGQDLLETRGPESIPNAVADVLVFALGHELARRWTQTG